MLDKSLVLTHCGKDHELAVRLTPVTAMQPSGEREEARNYFVTSIQPSNQTFRDQSRQKAPHNHFLLHSHVCGDILNLNRTVASLNCTGPTKAIDCSPHVNFEEHTMGQGSRTCLTQHQTHTSRKSFNQ